MELRFLKSQMTPHFLFNALNNIYSLVYIKDENAPKSILKLSDMLRYVMVDCQVDLISLEKEIKYIDAYIDFHQMSMETNSNVIFDKKIKMQTMGSVNMNNLVEGKAAVIESINGEFEPYVIHYAETFIIPEHIKEYYIRPLNENEKCGVIKAYVR